MGLQKIEEQPSGKLKLRHKLMLQAFGSFFIWLGNSMCKATTYEDVDLLGEVAGEKFDELEEEHKISIEEFNTKNQKQIEQ
jgi:hypothetical protein